MDAPTTVLATPSAADSVVIYWPAGVHGASGRRAVPVRPGQSLISISP
jgi:hypothetical protein